MTEHPERHLSAYLDEALDPAERASVAAHLEGCARCRAQLGDLRATSRLIGALPPLMPGHSLVPRVDRAPVWLRPVRLLGAMGSGLFVFLFIASAVVQSGSSLGGGTSTAEQLASRGQFGAAANALASDAARKLADSTGGPAPAPAAQQPGDRSASSGSLASSPSPTAVARADAASTAAVTPTETTAYRPTFGPPPQLFLALAAFCAVAAFAAHRRLRRT